ncbi:MAG: DNA repair protein RecO [Acidimicrobiia bacterium]
MAAGTGLYRDHGVVLRTYKLGEADRIVVFATQNHGKVRAVAKGVRKTRSKFGARLEPLSHVALQLYPGRDLDIVTQAETVDHFRAIREDFDRYSRGVAMLEAIDQLCLEGESNPRFYQMLVGALRALAERDSPLMVSAFYFKLLAQEGVQPELDVCVACGDAVDLVAFDVHEGGALCRSCRSGVSLSSPALQLLRLVLGGGLVEALAVPPSPATDEIDALATMAMEHHLERRLKSLRTLDRA